MSAIDVSTREGRAELRRLAERAKPHPSYAEFDVVAPWAVVELLDLVDALGGNAEVERGGTDDCPTWAERVARTPGGWWASLNGGAEDDARKLRDALTAALLDAAEPDVGQAS